VSIRTTTHDRAAAAPLIWNRPRLRFLDGAPDGAAPDAAPEPQEPADDAQPDAEQPEGADALGDAGKKALDAMKADRNAARAEAKQLQAELAALKAAQEGREAEHQAEQEAQRVRDEAFAKANERIVSAELRAAAAGKLADPTDALAFINPKDFEVGDDGTVDADAISAAITDLIKTKPHLAAQSDRRFEGSGDGGARKETNKPSQLTREDLKKLTPQQVIAARDAGQLEDLLAPNR
jgi:hypothetical protein